jgi:coenzyme F420-reducing hydrogenase alpha subunit
VEARDILAAYREPSQVLVPWHARAGRAAWATEAPRGMCWHRYEIGQDGRIAEAQIVPPTSQNQARIEEDLRVFAPTVLDLPRAEATHRLEQMIRSYDPCISCATHFLDLQVEEA